MSRGRATVATTSTTIGGCSSIIPQLAGTDPATTTATPAKAFAGEKGQVVGPRVKATDATTGTTTRRMDLVPHAQRKSTLSLTLLLLLPASLLLLLKLLPEKKVE
ncbi:hypothetical protein ACH5RR_025910 [Cinchona calisaya]|uniref:Uncharacterized protein n=1 Tax=Cinchona calisaya TaxID=153742 RepID=A0ABD2Z100_9GENT